MNGFSNSNLTTEGLAEWWNTMKLKGAEYLSLGKEGKTYKLHARKHGAKQRLGQISLSTSDKKIAHRILCGLQLANSSASSPATVIEKYCEHTLRTADICDDNKESHRRFLESRIKTEKTNRSRLTCHLLPFCNRFQINDIKELYKRENVGKFLQYLKESVPGLETCISIVKTTKALLNWYDMISPVPLRSFEYREIMQSYRTFFAHKTPTDKIFLDSDNVRKLLVSESKSPELKARILAHLVGGLRHNEIEGLRWQDLDEKRERIKVMNAKGGVARSAQYPLILREAFSQLRLNHSKHLMPQDHIFTHHPYKYVHETIQKYIQEVCGVNGKGLGSTCLRRSGCDFIYHKNSTLCDKQLGHSNTTEITETYYCNKIDFRDLNEFWDDIYKELKNHKGAIMGQEDPAIYAGKIITLTAS